MLQKLNKLLEICKWIPTFMLFSAQKLFTKAHLDEYFFKK